MADLISVGLRRPPRNTAAGSTRWRSAPSGRGWCGLLGSTPSGGHLIPWAINTHNPIVVMDYDRAWTFWPGTLHLLGYRIRGRDRAHPEFSFATREVYAVVDLPALLHRQFLATHVEVDGLDTRFRVKFDPTERDEAERERPLLPPIAGFEDPPMKQLGPESPPDDAHYADWGADLEDVHITHLQQIRVQQIPTQLQGSAVGRFSIQPERSFDLDLSRVEFSHGALSVGDEVVLQELEGTTAGPVSRFDPRAVHDYDFMHYISASMALTGVTPGLHYLRHLIPDVTIKGGGGPVELVATLEQGVLTEGTHLNADASHITVETPEVALQGSLHIDGRVEAAAHGRRASVEAELAPVTLSLRAEPTATLTGPSLRVRASTDDLDSTSPLGAGDVVIDADSLKGQLAPWLYQLPKSLTVDTGEVGLQAHFVLRAPSLRGKGEVHAKTGWVVAHLAGHPMSATSR